MNKTMKMNEEINKKRVGIYTQESADITNAGDGFALKEVKSPVIDLTDEPDEINKSEEETTIQTKTLEMQQEDTQEDVSSQTVFVRGRERDKLNKATKLESFPNCEEYYGKERWDKALQILQKLSYVNWEINTMFKALDSFPKKTPKRKLIENVSQDQKVTLKKPHLDDFLPKEEIKPEVISGILLKEDYSIFDLRANMGDASHPNFYILPEHKTKFYLEFYKLIRQDECFQDDPDPIVCSYFVNKTLMIECKNSQISERINKKICRLKNRLWPEADIVMLPRSSESQNIQIYIPYPSYSDVAEILEIITKQNRLPVDEWKVKNTEKYDDGIRLDVEVDGGTYLRLIEDQDDIFFLMKKVTIKLPQNDETKINVEQKNEDE